MSTVAVLTKRSNDPKILARKALDSMRAPQDKEAEVIVDGDTAVGFVGSIASTGKHLVSTQLEGGSRIVLIATSELLRESVSSAVDEAGERALTGVPDFWDIISRAALHQRGGWSLIGGVAGRLLGGRDFIGQRPLFWGRNSNLAMLASSRKALWSLGVSSVSCFPQGTLVGFDKGQHRKRRMGRLTKPKRESLGKDQAAVELLELLRTSIKTVVQRPSKVGVLFSGGLDSSIVAALSDNLGLETHLYTAAFEDSSDIASAERAAELIGLKLEAEVVSLDEAEDVLRKVVWEIESSDPIQVCVGMPIEVATRKAVRRGERLLLSGSGADELFGGYSKYLEAYRKLGEDGVADVMFRDVLRLGRKDLLRDGAIGEANRVQLSAPFLDLELVKFGLKIPVSLKIQGMDDGLRKRALRRAAGMMAVPEEIVELPKRAAQYSSKSLAVAKRLARGKGLSLHSYLESTFNEIFNSHRSKASPEP